MKITKSQLKQMIKEELGKVTEGNFEQAYNDLLGEEEEEGPFVGPEDLRPKYWPRNPPKTEWWKTSSRPAAEKASPNPDTRTSEYFPELDQTSPIEEAAKVRRTRKK